MWGNWCNNCKSKCNRISLVSLFYPRTFITQLNRRLENNHFRNLFKYSNWSYWKITIRVRNYSKFWKSSHIMKQSTSGLSKKKPNSCMRTIYLLLQNTLRGGFPCSMTKVLDFPHPVIWFKSLYSCFSKIFIDRLKSSMGTLI